jgi:hypothetical protein
MNRFLRQGGFRTRRFLLYLALRPWHWAKALRLASSSRRAAENLCAWLRESALRTTIIPSALAQTDPDGHRNPADLSSPAREDSDHHAGGRLPRSR